MRSTIGDGGSLVETRCRRCGGDNGPVRVRAGVRWLAEL